MKNAKKNSSGEQKVYLLTRNYEALGEYLQKMRTQAELTQREVSLALGYSSAQFISNFERGIARPPKKKLVELIRIYDMPLEKVMKLILEGQREELQASLQASTSRRNPKRA